MSLKCIMAPGAQITVYTAAPAHDGPHLQPELTPLVTVPAGNNQQAITDDGTTFRPDCASATSCAGF